MSTELRTSLIEVTPAMAEKWLADHNHNNRPISATVVKRYADEMKSGHWMLTHQGPAFDVDHRLIDGQHRLAAVSLAQVDVPMYVTFGADPATFVVLDINYKRQAGHIIPGPYANVKAAAARLLTDPPRLGTTNRNFHNRDAVRIVAEHPHMDAAAALADRVYKATRISRGLHTALLTLALESPLVSGRVEEWAEGLISGAGLEKSDPRLVLRNRWALEAKYLNGGMGRQDAAYLIVRAWNAHVAGEQITRIPIPRIGASQIEVTA